MKLSRQDVDLFFKLMWALQLFVNQKLNIIPEVETQDDILALSPSERLEIREALFDNIELIDAFVEENPQGFTAEELDIVAGWKKFKRGNFFIERLLKKHAIFIGDDNQVYGVLELYDSFEDVLRHGRLPYYTRAILLPFKGKIVYDGLLEGYAISFGGGIRRNLKETYMAAKQNGRIIESFDPQRQAEKSMARKKSAKDWGPALDDLSQQAKKLRSSSGAPAIYSPAFSLIKASIEFAKLAAEDPDDTDQLWKALKKVKRAMGKAETVLYRAKYF